MFYRITNGSTGAIIIDRIEITTANLKEHVIVGITNTFGVLAMNRVGSGEASIVSITSELMYKVKILNIFLHFMLLLN